MTFYTYWPAKKTLFHFCCNLFKVGHIFVIDCLDYVVNVTFQYHDNNNAYLSLLRMPTLCGGGGGLCSVF